LLVFVIYFFNVTSMMGLESISFFQTESKPKVKTTMPPASDNGVAEKEESLTETEKLAAVVEAIKEEVEQEEQEAEPAQVEAEEEAPAPEEDLTTEAWEVKKVEPKKKTPPKPDLVLDVELTEELGEEEQSGNSLNFEVEATETKEVKTETLENYDPTLDLGSYQYPTPDLLIDYPEKNVQVSKEELEQNKDKIVETLINFKIGISSIKATIGPTVTLYEIVPEAGVKISKIKNLEDDIALSLAALGIRIIAPIPGKGTIGIEVPNKNREMVDVKSILTTDKFMKSDKELPVVLGKTISNEVFVTDLAKMPHLLMAGATGQGKSVGLNILLTSLIYKKHPSQLKFVLVDPKKVELTLFNKIERHFLAKLPDSEEAIITDTKKVIYTLNSLCIEMDNRYDLLKDAGCRNLKEYNRKFVQRKLNPNSGHRFLPYIVLVIDELADLMMTAGKEVETPIARLAQLARAIGIHLVLATQRPSVNVITGVIKANFPARLSFRVTSKIDSRTILDAGGADQLVGMGDMLLSMGSEIIRLQCGFVDTPEVERICEFVGSQRGYESAYMLPEYVGEDGESGVGDVDLADRDVLFDDAARLIVAHQQGSTSLIQRKLKLGYNRAGRLIDQLEAAGIVGPFEGSKAREVLVKDEYSLEQLLNDL
jgi:S-DNA-T family DNA segregation ATPase FtsK/SpoIIIE